MEGLFDDLAVNSGELAGEVPGHVVEGRLDRHEPIHKHRPFITTRHTTLPRCEAVHTGKIQPPAVIDNATVGARGCETEHRDGAIKPDQPVRPPFLNLSVFRRPASRNTKSDAVEGSTSSSAESQSTLDRYPSPAAALTLSNSLTTTC